MIKRAIIDKNARIGDGVVITPDGKPDNYDSENYYIRDGVVVIPKNAVLPSGKLGLIPPLNPTGARAASLR